MDLQPGDGPLMNPAPPDEIREITDIRTAVKTKELPKEETARTVAHSLLLTFRVSLWGTLLLGFTTIIVDHWSGKGQAGVLIKDSVVPMLTSAGTFGSTLFGPLLAFVLGYYFGERKNQ
jgi:hypothetical protein